MKTYYLLLLLLICGLGCQDSGSTVSKPKVESADVELVVLGTVQDGGAPHIGCKKSCCTRLWAAPDKTLKVVSLGVIDRVNDKVYVFEATPDFPEQLAQLNARAGRETSQMPDGIFLTHAHIGHYTGLMFLGREAKGAKEVPVYAMPKMKEFLESNGPWDQLVNLKNISIVEVGESEQELSSALTVRPFRVPHRDEYSETVGFTIIGKEKSVLFIPDIDKWSKWEEDIIDKIASVNAAFIDATFYDEREIAYRNIGEIPHPFVIESMEHFKNLPPSEKEKVHFIHLNHTNPLLDVKSKAYQKVNDMGFRVAKFLQILPI